MQAPVRSLDRAAASNSRALGRRVLGPAFAEADSSDARAAARRAPCWWTGSWKSTANRYRDNGRVVTEHDVRRAVDSTAAHVTTHRVEAGQGISSCPDPRHRFQTRGRSMYAADARSVSTAACGRGRSHPLRHPHEGFFSQSDAWLFRSASRRRSTARRCYHDGGLRRFLPGDALAAGKGIVRTALDLKPCPASDRRTGKAYQHGVESYSGTQLAALRAGDLAACFGADSLGCRSRIRHVPGGGCSGASHRAARPRGGRFGLGIVSAKRTLSGRLFLTCHFVDDRVMPARSFECCMHTRAVSAAPGLDRRRRRGDPRAGSGHRQPAEVPRPGARHDEARDL